MCNLYRMTKPTAEVARLFGAIDGAAGGNQGELVFPGYPGVVIVDGEVRTMVWGFPYAMRSKKTGNLLKPKPVNNARSEKLMDGRSIWKPSFESRRCLIPVSAFAEAEGEKGSMTRTWISVPGQDLFACAGIWRDSVEWGLVYSMVMTTPSPATAEVHDRMPVILAPEDRSAWTDGSVDQALALCRPYEGEVTIDRTDERWAR